MDRTFQHRTRAYRAWVLLLFPSTLLVAAGFSSSHWVDTGPDHYGLWVGCFSSPSHDQQATCRVHSGDTAVDSILQVPQILTTLEITALVIACIVAVVTNCRHYVPRPRQRYLELIISLAGLLGSVGCGVFWAHEAKLDAANATESTLSWSFFFVFFPSIISFVSACVISCKNDVIPESDESNLVEVRSRQDSLSHV